MAGDNMNKFLNENWRDILEDLQPMIEDIIGQIIKKIAQQLLYYIPEKQLLLD